MDDKYKTETREFDSGLKVQTRFRRGSMQIKDQTYTYKDPKVAKFELTGKIAGELAAFLLIQKDLSNALEWQRQQKKFEKEDRGYYDDGDNNGADVYKALFVASVTAYSKCFVSSRRRHVFLDQDDWVGEKFVVAHKNVMELQNSFTAQSISSDFEKVSINLLLIPGSGDRKSKYIRHAEIKQLNKAIIKNEFFIKLIQHVLDKVKRKIEDLDKQVCMKEIEPNLEDYTKLAKKQLKRP